MEYVFQLPYGLSIKEIENHKHLLEDGLNTKQIFSFEDIKKLRLNKNIWKQIKQLFKQEKARKEIELSFDGILKIKVYDEPLPTNIEWNDTMKANNWAVPVGFNRSGLIRHDFEKRPHMVVAGATGYGKSQYLKMLITSLLLSKPNKCHLCYLIYCLVSVQLFNDG